MALKVTFKSWIKLILTAVMLQCTPRVYANCGKIQYPLDDIQYPKGASIRWTPDLGSVDYSEPKRTVGSIAEFRCKDGFYVRGAKTAVCGEHGKWIISENELQCDRIKCIEPNLDMEHGRIEISVEDISPEPQVYIVNSTYWVICDSGYKPKDSAVRVCLFDDTATDDIFKGIWAQRDIDGKLLLGGDTSLECIKDTHFHNISSQLDADCSHGLEHGFLAFLGVLYGVVILGIIITILILKIKPKRFKNWLIEKNIITASDIEAYNNCIEMQQLLDQSGPELMPLLNRLIREKKIKIASLEAYTNDFETQQLSRKSGPELIPLLNKLIEEKNINIANLPAYYNDFEMQQLLGKSESALVETINTLIQRKKIKIADLQPYTHADEDRLKELNNEQCSKCVNNCKYVKLKQKRYRLVDTIVSIKKTIKKMGSLGNFKQTNDGGSLAGLIGEIKGIVSGSNTRLTRNSDVSGSTWEFELEVNEMHIEVTHLKQRLGIPCEYCKDRENECEKIENQIQHLASNISEINDKIYKLKSVTNEVSNIKASQGRNLIWLVADMISQVSHCRDIDLTNKNQSNTSNSDGGDDVSSGTLKDKTSVSASGNTGEENGKNMMVPSGSTFKNSLKYKK